MKSLQMLGLGKTELAETDEPEPVDDLVVVKIMSSMICGTERTAFYAKRALKNVGGAGHEAAGIIFKTDKAQKVKEGDRVSIYPTTFENCHQCPACHEGEWLHCGNPRPKRSPMGTHTQYMLVPEYLCLPIPDDLSFDTCAMIDDCIGTAYKAIKRLNVTAGDIVLITGTGPIGAAANIICKFFNATTIAVDINDYRLQQIASCGADFTFNADKDRVLENIKEITDNQGADVAIDCSGMDVAQVQCLNAARSFGRVAFLGIKSEQTSIRVLQQFILKELTVIGSWASTPPQHFEIINLIQQGMPVDQLITHRFGMSEAPIAFEKFFAGDAVKVAINPWDL